MTTTLQHSFFFFGGGVQIRNYEVLTPRPVRQTTRKNLCVKPPEKTLCAKRVAHGECMHFHPHSLCEKGATRKITRTECPARKITRTECPARKITWTRKSLSIVFMERVDNATRVSVVWQCGSCSLSYARTRRGGLKPSACMR